MFRKIPVIGKDLTALLVKPFTLANMKESTSATDGKVLYGRIFTEAIGDDGGVLLVFTKLDFLLAEPDVKKSLALFKRVYIKVVDKYIRKDGTK